MKEKKIKCIRWELLSQILHCFHSKDASVEKNSTLPILVAFVFKGTGGFVYNQERSKESSTHEKIQSNLELVLLCVSTSAVILALILLTTLR